MTYWITIVVTSFPILVSFFMDPLYPVLSMWCTANYYCNGISQQWDFTPLMSVCNGALNLDGIFGAQGCISPVHTNDDILNHTQVNMGTRIDHISLGLYAPWSCKVEGCISQIHLNDNIPSHNGGSGGGLEVKRCNF